jgi:DNA-binding beta-propeller fold protein YncE
MVRIAGNPFGVAALDDWSFVDELNGGVVVVSDVESTPRVLRTIAVPGEALGNSVTRDGRYLLVADGGGGASVLSVARAEAGSGHALLGRLRQPVGSTAGGGAIEVTSSNDGRYAFVAIENADAVAVYDLHAAIADHFDKRTYVGSVPLGPTVVGLAVSPDGRWLYATSEQGNSSRSPGTLSVVPQGTLSVISVTKAERHPAVAVVATVGAHCSPVRVVVSADGSTVWVSARESDQVLAYSSRKLLTDPKRALLAAVRVGAEPVGLALVADGRDLVVADSDRYAAPGERADLNVVDASAALAHRPAIVGSIPAGAFPREMAVEPNGKALLVSNFGSGQLEKVSIATLPRGTRP